jgi:hypothetical protein
MSLPVIIAIVIASNILTGVLVYTKTSKKYERTIKDIRVAFNSSMVSNRRLEGILGERKQ